MPSELSLGICCLDTKGRSRPMQEIIKRLKSHTNIDVVYIGDEYLLSNSPVQNWPICSFLLAIYSSGFPLQKALEYCQLRSPHLINDLHMQGVLRDRTEIKKILESLKVPHKTKFSLCFDSGDYDDLIECEDYIEYDGTRLYKPFVEKPLNADDHNVRVYYHSNQGGGVRQLFRKVNDRSSEYYPEQSEIRRDGTYLYEEFAAPDAGLDIKVYVLGRDYYHAEGRKAPTVDGMVERLPSGLESRHEVTLTDEERDMVFRVAHEFKQGVCGIDLLRSDGRPYILDVNGWSFVKGHLEFYESCARYLSNLINGNHSSGGRLSY